MAGETNAGLSLRNNMKKQLRCGRRLPLKEYFRLILRERQGGRCYYCNKVMLVRKRELNDKNHDDDETLDHVVPKSKGGRRNNLSNFRLSCFRCNYLKANK